MGNTGHNCTEDVNCNNFEIGKITYDSQGKNAQLDFYENLLGNQPGIPDGGELDAAAEDCSSQIIMASVEVPAPPDTTPYVADLTKADLSKKPNWTDPASTFFTLTGSDLGPGDNLGSTGPIAIAQGTSHLGILGQEAFATQNVHVVANTVTAFRLNTPFNKNAPYKDWVTCNLGTDSKTSILFRQGEDPHTVTAYQSPNQDPLDGTYHSFAVLANSPPATTIAVVDLDLMMKVPRYPGTNVCNTPPLDSKGVGTLTENKEVRFIELP